MRRHLAELVVVGFNSGKYNLNVLKDILIPYLVHRSDIDLTIKCHHAYLVLRTGALKTGTEQWLREDAQSDRPQFSNYLRTP